MNDHRHFRLRGRKDFYFRQMKLPACAGTRLLRHSGFGPDTGFFLKQAFYAALFRFQDTLDEAVRSAQDEERKSAHFPDSVNTAMQNRLLVQAGCKLLRGWVVYHGGCLYFFQMNHDYIISLLVYAKHGLRLLFNPAGCGTNRRVSLTAAARVLI